MGTVTIYHNPNCGTSRNTLALIRNAGEDPRVVRYLETPPGKAELLGLITAMGIPVRDVLRKKGTPYEELDLDNPRWTDDELVDFMLQHPILINRPIVVTPMGTRLCRPSEVVLDILPQPQRGAFTKEDGEAVVDAGGRRVPMAHAEPTMSLAMNVIVLGTGCSKCVATAALIERVANDLGVSVALSKIESREEISRLGVHATPAVMVDGKLVHAGGIPSHEKVQSWLTPVPLELLKNPTRYIFFTGKGGVGKTSLSTAVALRLADTGKRVLLVSTDAASNLDEMLGVTLSNQPVPVPGATGLSVLNIDPDNAAEAYRQRVVAQMDAAASDAEIATVREQLSGACTTEIASFDEFSSLLAATTQDYDHIIFDTAPTGHTLRLLSLPKAWSGFLAGNDRGASCLGPHSGLKMQEIRFKAALEALSNPALTTVVLVTRPDAGAIVEASRTSDELQTLGLHNQRLVINGVFHASDHQDAVAAALEALGAQALAAMPENLKALPQDQVPLRPFDTVGLPALRNLLVDTRRPGGSVTLPVVPDCMTGYGLEALADELAQAEHGLIMVMGKGGVGKTTIAAALALGLVQRGKTVHLSTTDPAAHLTGTLNGAVQGLRVDRIDPVLETQRYVDKIMATKGAGLDAQERALMLEDLRSPCTEEVAVFHAFSRVVSEARSAFVVLDTAPTGHSLLLMDATGAYHRQMMRELEGHTSGRIVTPLMRLQDPAYTKIILVALPEVTPVLQAEALQNDLRRAKIEPFAWVINKSVLASGTRDPLLSARLAGEARQVNRIANELAKRTYVLPWLAKPPVGVEQLSSLVRHQNATN